jgi:hypothetical protein
MKKKLLSVLAAVALGAVVVSTQSCEEKEIAKALFNEFMTEPMQVPFEIQIVPGSNNVFFSLDSTQIQYSLDEEIRKTTNGKFGINDADAVYIHSMRLVLDDATQTSNFANFTAMNVMLTSSNSSSVVEAGTVRDIPDTYDTEIDINVDKSINMKEYFNHNTIYYLLYGTSRRATDKVLHGKAYVSYMVH